MKDKNATLTGVFIFQVFDNMLTKLISIMEEREIETIKGVMLGVPGADMLQYLVFLKCCNEREIYTCADLKGLIIGEKLELAADFYKAQGEAQRLINLANEKIKESKANG